MPAAHPAGPATALAWRFDFVGRELLVSGSDDEFALLPIADDVDAADLNPLVASQYLGTLDGIDCWARSLIEAPPGRRPVGLRRAMMAFDPALAAIAGRAAQVLDWDRTHRHCGVCATPTELRTQERARVCPACGLVVYPRISPAMMTLIWRPGELLLARSPHHAPGLFTALAGFVEAGESLEDCIHREVAEEVGVTVDDLRYFGSQSWPFPNSLMVAFTARWRDGVIVPQPGEIEDARWFAIDDLPLIPGRFSIAGLLLRGTIEAMRADAAAFR
ncbi:NAD(+) diphosphatase [soil metagenome]